MLNYILYTFLAIILFIFYKFFIKPYRHYSYYRSLGHPGSFFPLVGLGKVAIDSLKKKGDMLANYKELPYENPKAQIYVSNFGDRCALQVLDHNLLKEFYANSDHYEKTKASAGMMMLLGNGLIRLEGNEWKKRRKIISTMFHFNFINTNLPLILQTTREFLLELKKGPMKDVYIMDEVQKITGEIVGRIFFGNNLNQYKIDGQLLTLFLADLLADVASAGSGILVVLFGFTGLNPTMLPDYKKKIQNIKRFRDVCIKIVSDRKKNPIKTNDLLALLLEYQAKNKDTEDQISDSDIVDEFITFFSAGMDTTGHMVAMAIYLLAKNPEKIQRLESEVEKVKLEEATITNEQVNQLEFHQNVLKEALRLFTPAPGTFPRFVKEDFMLGDIKIFKGVSIRPNFFYNFMHPDYFEEPKMFKPERWEKESKLDPFIFVPFSAGSRNCIGQHLAMIEGKIILAEILRMFKFTIPEDYVVKMTARFLYEPTKKIPIDLIPKI